MFVRSEICKGCSFCVDFCPTDCLSFSTEFNPKGYHFPVLSAPEACTGCDLCGLYCPDFAIYGERWKDIDERKAKGRPQPVPEPAAPAPVKPAWGTLVPTDPRGVLTGLHFMDGDHATCEGAIAAGCRFAAGYPITPSTEVVERFAARIPVVGGLFIQMEDELASSIAVQGAAWGGKKTLSVTSGPGFSLMMEHIGLAAVTETPGVWVNVQRGGPSTGLPTLPGQADMMQAKWGSHGDYEIIALVPNSPQECFDLMIKAFNLSEVYRCPVMFMMDEVVGHMVERVEIPPAERIQVVPRRLTTKPKGEYLPFATTSEDLVPEMTVAGAGHRIHVTGLTHDERGYPAMNAAAQDKMVTRLVRKIRDHADALVDVREHYLDDAEIVVVSYGITSRIAKSAVDDARARGLRVGHLRLRIVWPFPAARIRALCQHAKAFLVPELNMGQVVLEIERVVAGQAKVIGIPHAGGSVHEPDAILKKIIEATQ
ncbi:MAG: 2-oxoacid:acceptor oxidoreductase subunit alpha [Deltaproteobacteria bacterium]|nr:2-oxoacid:acceptor oxidoreductase subunit alpha [Deltaproteobacteria bacterium]